MRVLVTMLRRCARSRVRGRRGGLQEKGRPDQDNRDVLVEAASRSRRLPVPAQRRGRRKDVGSVDHQRHVLEGGEVLGPGRPPQPRWPGDVRRTGDVHGRPPARDVRRAIEAARLRVGAKGRFPAASREQHAEDRDVEMAAPAVRGRLPVRPTAAQRSGDYRDRKQRSDVRQAMHHTGLGSAPTRQYAAGPGPLLSACTRPPSLPRSPSAPRRTERTGSWRPSIPTHGDPLFRLMATPRTGVATQPVEGMTGIVG